MKFGDQSEPMAWSPSSMPDRRAARRVADTRSPAGGVGSGDVRIGRDAGVVVDVEVEVDADPLEEVVVQRDEPHLDRHLQVLQAAELFQQVGDLLVNVLRLADDQAQVRRERLDLALARAVFHPAFVLDGRR